MAVRKHPRQYQGRTTMPRAQADQDAFPRRHRHGVRCYARGDVCTRGVPADPAHAAARHGGHLGETPSRAKEHEDRLEALASYLSRALTDDQVYSIIDPTPIGAAITAARSTQPLAECNGCERDLGRLLRADRVLVGQVDKVSTLIGSLSLRVVDVKSGQIVFGRTISFRGDTDEAWEHAGRFFVRYLEATPVEGR